MGEKRERDDGMRGQSVTVGNDNGYAVMMYYQDMNLIIRRHSVS